MTLVYLAGAWLIGIPIKQAVGGPWWLPLPLFVVAGIGWWIAGRRRPDWQIPLACMAMLSLGALRYGLVGPHVDAGHVAYYATGEYVTLEGFVDDRPDTRDTHVNLRVRVETITPEGGAAQRVRGRALVQAPRGEAYRYGDVVRVQGRLETPPEFETFSYREYLARQGVYGMVRYASVEVTGGRRGSPIRRALADFRERAYEVIVRLLPDPQAALLAGILLGIESGISPDVQAAFDAVGATHVIAISGSNLVILAGVFRAIAGRLTRDPRGVAAATIGGVIGYTIFVGGDAAVVRAAVMTTLALVAAETGRQTTGVVSLSFAALLMSAIDPRVLWDVGFQLSFLATLGLILYVDPLQKGLERALERVVEQDRARQVVGLLSDAVLVSIAAQIATAPLMAARFERFSVVSLPVNILIVPAQTPLMVLGGLAVLAALVVWPVGQVIAWGSWLFLTWTVGVVRMFAKLPFASAEVHMPPLAVWLAYGLLFGGTALAQMPPETRERLVGRARRALGVKAMAATGLIAAALLFVGAGSLPDGRLHVTFFDVGDGAAALVETPGGRQILVDAGGSGRSLTTGLGDALPFWDRRIDLLVISQPTQARAGGLPNALRRYRFDAVLASSEPNDGGALGSAWAALDEQEARRIDALPGTTIRVEDGVTLTVVGVGTPPGEDESAPPTGLMVEYGDVRILLPGDLSPEEEAILTQTTPGLHAAVLHAPRGGHHSGTTETLLEAVGPDIVVISASGSDAPDPETVERIEGAGATIYRTDENGTIRLTTDGEQVWVRTAR
jgi:competence protein ComEC